MTIIVNIRNRNPFELLTMIINSLVYGLVVFVCLVKPLLKDVANQRYNTKTYY